MSRRFTPREANKTLPLVKHIVEDFLEKGRELRSLQPQRRETKVRERCRTLELELKQLMAELERIGCSYKDWSFELGLVDFPAEIEGEEVLLCWRSDEDAVTWYHKPEAGYAGRQPIPAELLDPANSPS